MFEATLEAQALNNNERRFRSLSTAIVAHATLISAIVVVTAMIVPDVKGPDAPLDVVFRKIDPNFLRSLAPNDPAPTIARPKPATGSRPVTPVVPRPIEQPRETPNTIPEIPLSGAPGPDVTDGHGGPDDGENGNGSSDSDGDGDGGGGEGSDFESGPQPLTPDMVRPVLVSKVEPVYPQAARVARMQGRVVVEAVIGLDGRVESAVVLSSSNGLFDEAALAAVRKWTYTPAKMNGSPVRVYFTVQVSFVLR
jgi:periplasmic protein TonB